MISILQAKFSLFVRKPILFLAMTSLSIVFALILAGGDYTTIQVPVYSEIEDIEETALWKELTKSETYEFYLLTEEEVKRIVSEGDVEAGLELQTENFKLIIAAETGNIPLLQSFVQSVYNEILLEQHILNSVESETHIDVNQVVTDLRNQKENPVFGVDVRSFRGNDTVIINNQLQSVFGITLFFVIYTIANNVMQIIEEKRLGVWDRMILSPLRKWEMYAGNLVYSFLLGYAQIAIIFLVFRYVAGVDFQGGFYKTLVILIPYVFTIVALSIFIASIVRSVRHFNAIIPFVSVSMAMIGGAYWPLEIVSAEFLLKLSNFMPIMHAMEALKGVTIYGEALSEQMFPISILMLMGILLIGIGINVMERRSV